MQNFGRFSTTSDFDREYLRNGARYRKSERHVISSDSFRVRRKGPVNFGPLYLQRIPREFEPTKMHFLADYISAPGGAAT